MTCRRYGAVRLSVLNAHHMSNASERSTIRPYCTRQVVLQERPGKGADVRCEMLDDNCSVVGEVT